MASKPIHILSWNVNGIRAAAKKGFAEWLRGCGGEIVGLQEVRAQPEQVPAEVLDRVHDRAQDRAQDRSPERAGWHAHFSAAERRGYSGVALFARRKPDAVETSLGEPRFDDEGRLQIARFGRLVVVNGYFPNGNGKERDNSRVPYKLDFYAALFDRVQRLRRGGYRVVVMGDFNTAHREIDLARPKENAKTSGFLPEERAELDRWVEAGWIDTFRASESGPGHYSWWSQRGGARARNVGWRIDYILASPAAMKFVRNGSIHPEVTGSDHCPISIQVDPAIFT